MNTGFGDLRGFVESLTGKSYVGLLSHGRMDHAGGAGQFETVYLNQRDWELEKWRATRERRVWAVHHGPGGIFSRFSPLCAKLFLCWRGGCSIL